MNTTSLVMTVTDELLAEPEEITSRQPGALLSVRSSSMNLIYSELRRLRADNAELEQSLAESRANDQASMAWLSAYRVAARGGDMPLPEMVSHIEGLAKDAGRYRWLRNQSMEYRQNGPAAIMAEVSGEKGAFIELDDLDSAIDTAMAAQ